TQRSMIQGFVEEQIEELNIFSLYIGVDFIKVSASMIIMSTIGAITDVAISITSPMREIFIHHPNISRKELFKSGMNIGRDILGSNTNTLFFAFFGAYMGLLIWFKDMTYSLGEVVNSKVFAGEIMIILCAGIGIVFIGGYLGLFILVKDMTYFLGEVVNYKVFAGEIMIILCAGIGIALITPVAAWINAAYLVRRREKAK